jgi:hypothetical protein
VQVGNTTTTIVIIIERIKTILDIFVLRINSLYYLFVF